MTSYNEKLAQDYETIRDKVRRGMLPLVARNPEIERVVGEYAVAHAHHYDVKREKGESPPINYKDSDTLDRFADLIMYEELTWSHPDKMSIVEFPVASDRNEKSYREKYSPNPDLQYGDRRFLGRRTTTFTDNVGNPQMRKTRVPLPVDPTIISVETHLDLYDALDNADLTDKQRQAISLVFFDNEGDGMSQEDARKVMGVSKATMSEHLSVAVRKLRDYMTID